MRWRMRTPLERGQQDMRSCSWMCARLEFPLARSRDDLESGSTPEAIRHVQDTLTQADHVLLFYPVWNGAMPALLKGFVEQTFRSSCVFPAKPDDQLVRIPTRELVPGDIVRLETASSSMRSMRENQIGA
jgi:putative NADPH-quinone reductase